MAEELGIFCNSCQIILTSDLGASHVSAKFVPWLLIQEQKETCFSAVYNLLECAETDENLWPQNWTAFIVMEILILAKI